MTWGSGAQEEPAWSKWRPWFAWYPVRFNETGEWAWLRVIACRGRFLASDYLGINDSHYQRQYGPVGRVFD